MNPTAPNLALPADDEQAGTIANAPREEEVEKLTGLTTGWLNVARRLQSLAQPPKTLEPGLRRSPAILSFAVMVDQQGQPQIWALHASVRLEPKQLLLQTLLRSLGMLDT